LPRREGTDEENRRKTAWKKEGGGQGSLKKQLGNKTKKKGRERRQQ